MGARRRSANGRDACRVVPERVSTRACGGLKGRPRVPPTVAPPAARLYGLVRGRPVVVLAVVLVAIRFAAPSLSASLAVAGLDVSGLDAFFVAYDGVLPVAEALLSGLLLITWPEGFRRDLSLVPVLVLLVWEVAFYPGEVDSGYRLLQGPWASLPLGIGAAATVLAYGWALETRTRRAATGAMAKDGFRSLYVGFAAAYLFGSLRFIDYRLFLGSAPPSGWLWFVNYAPTLLLGSFSIYFWARSSLPSEPEAAWAVRTLILPAIGVVGGVFVAQGLGGFILSSALAWGGAYGVFVPTQVSLSFVGFAIGAFLATAWTLRGRLPGAVWRWVVGGVTVAALAGIQPFGGTMASLLGIMLGLTLAARGLLDLPS